MSPLVMATLRPRRSPAFLVAALGAVALAVGALVTVPRHVDRGRTHETRCPPQQHGDYVRGCALTAPIALEIDTRHADPGFAQPPPPRLSRGNGCGLPASVGSVPSYVPR